MQTTNWLVYPKTNKDWDDLVKLTKSMGIFIRVESDKDCIQIEITAEQMVELHRHSCVGSIDGELLR